MRLRGADTFGVFADQSVERVNRRLVISRLELRPRQSPQGFDARLGVGGLIVGLAILGAGEIVVAVEEGAVAARDSNHGAGRRRGRGGGGRGRREGGGGGGRRAERVGGNGRGEGTGQ